MPTTLIKYAFYAVGATPPSWLVSGDHDVPKAMIPVQGGINTAMQNAMPNSAISSVMRVWENVLDIDFNTSSGTKNIAYGGWTSTSLGAATTFTQNGSTGNYAILTNTRVVAGVNMSLAAISNWGGWVEMHELGHILGLTHPDGMPLNPLTNSYNESADLRFTFMHDPKIVLNAQGNRIIDPNIKIPLTPGMTDIETLRTNPAYGPSTTRNGNDTYKFTETDINFTASTATTSRGGALSVTGDPEKYVMTIWDGGGTDTIDAAGMNTKNYINLNPGTFSSIGSNIRTAPSGNGGVEYNVGIALNAQIENAIGGSKEDTIIGNLLSNTIFGNDGSDAINGDFSGSGLGILFGGNDFLYGGKDDDALNGQLGNDLLHGGTGSNYMVGGTGKDDFYFDVSRLANSTNTWSTIADFGTIAGETATLWGWNPSVSKLVTKLDSSSGATYHYDLDGNNAIDTSITFTNRTLAEVGAGLTGTAGGVGYIYFGSAATLAAAIVSPDLFLS